MDALKACLGDGNDLRPPKKEYQRFEAGEM